MFNYFRLKKYLVFFKLDKRAKNGKKNSTTRTKKQIPNPYHHNIDGGVCCFIPKATKDGQIQLKTKKRNSTSALK